MIAVMARCELLAVALPVLLALWALPCRAQNPSRGIDDIIENVRRIIREGDKELGIPVLDPFHLDKVERPLSKNRTYEVEGALRQLIATGLGDFVAQVDTKLLPSVPLKVRMTVGISVSQFAVKGDHQFDAILGEVVHLYGKGDFELLLEQLNVTAVIEISARLLSPVLQSVSTKLALGDILIHVSGLMDGGNIDPLLGTAAREVSRYVLEDQRETLEEALNKALEGPIEKIIDKYSWKDLLCILIPSTCGAEPEESH